MILIYLHHALVFSNVLLLHPIIVESIQSTYYVNSSSAHSACYSGTEFQVTFSSKAQPSDVSQYYKLLRKVLFFFFAIVVLEKDFVLGGQIVRILSST